MNFGIDQKVLDGDVQWVQCRVGYSLKTLDGTIQLVARHGIKVDHLLCSKKRFQLLMPHLDKVTNACGIFWCDNKYTGIPFVIWETVPDEYLYVVGDKDPPTVESVAVMCWRRPENCEVP